ncbi:MAG TPA: Mur ligase domain-containing protein [Candidatus Saccharimonadales bacterium]
MHIYFSRIGGAGISAAALLARQAGFEVSGSDKQETPYLDALREHGITDITIGQSYEHIAKAHAERPIDWLVYSSVVKLEDSGKEELRFCEEHGIRTSRRDEFLNMLIEEKHQKLIALAGTHGKSTTTAMVVWLCKELGIPVSYAMGAKVTFADLSAFNDKSEYFIYECDEFDRNFLAFKPFLAGITGLSWDHHEIFPSLENYNQAFRDFIGQSTHTIMWKRDALKLGLEPGETIDVVDQDFPSINDIRLRGRYNREDAELAMQLVSEITRKSVEELRPIVERFPGLKQRMELLVPNLYTNYAHTPEKIRGGMSTALEIAKENGQDVVVIYEGLTNRRQHFIKNDYKDCFAGAKKLYWVPSYLAREDPSQAILTPAELITHLSDPSIAEPAELNDALLKSVHAHLAAGDLVVAMGASGKGSLDDWLRENFAR